MVYQEIRDRRPGNEQSNNGLCVSEARTPNAKTRQLPSSGTVTPPEKAQLRIRTNSINGTRNNASVMLSDVQAWLGLARPDEGLRKSKPGPQAFKSLSRPKPWA